MKLGIDILLNDENLLKQLKNKRLSLLGHPASVNSEMEHTLDLLMKNPNTVLSSCFGPQHGMRGEKQDNMVESDDYLDPLYKIPVFSLYGEVRRPTEKMMQSFDLLLVDLQDVGTRVYTFLTTLLYVLEACAKHNKEIWILDRPNPAGRKIEGNLLKAGWESFVGAGPLPMRHGLTLGEAAHWFVRKYKLNVNYKVVSMQGYTMNQAPDFGWPLQKLTWINPSPNAATPYMARAYPGTVIIEGTNLSEGRGTTRALEIVGAADIDQNLVFAEMHRMAPELMKKSKLRFCFFQPTFHKFQGQLCQGFQLHSDYASFDPNEFYPFRIIAIWLKAIRNIYPDYPIWRDFHYEYEKDRLAIDIINGGPEFRNFVDTKSATYEDYNKALLKDEKHWQEEIQDILIYKS